MSNQRMKFSPGQKVRHKSSGQIMVCERYEIRNSSIYLLKKEPFFFRTIYSQSQKFGKYNRWIECRWFNGNNILQKGFFQENELEPLN